MDTIIRTSLKSAALLCAVLFTFSVTSNAWAQTPRSFSYQGLITDPSGQPIPDGDHSVSVSLYRDSVGGKAIYGESHSAHTRGGLFSAVIGGEQGIPANISFSQPVFLGVSIDGNSELVPRTPLLSAPYAIHSDVAEVAMGLAPDASGVVTSINEISGAMNFVGDSTITVTQAGKTINFHATAKGGGSGLDGISALDKSVLVQNPNGPTAGIRVADNGITTANLADGSVTPAKLNQGGAAIGQILKWNGTKWVPANDSGASYTAGNGIAITGSTISVVRPLPNGTVVNSTLRWDGTNWVENQNFTSNQQGFTTINNTLVLSNTGPASELRLFEPSASGTNYTSFKAGAQTGDIQYTLPASLPGSTGFLRVDNTGVMTWAPSSAGSVTFDQVLSGINLNQTLTVGNGASLVPSGTGIVVANHFVGSGSLTQAVDLGTAEVAGILPIANGGTNSGATLSNNRLMVSNNGAIVEFTPGATGQVLFSGGNLSMPSWTTINLLPTGSANNSTLRWNSATGQWQENTNVLSTAAGQVAVNAGVSYAGTTSPILLNGSAGTIGQVLTSAGANATPTWTNMTVLPTGTTTNATLRWNGSSWVEDANVLESAAGQVTANAGANLNGTGSPLLLNNSAGTTGQVLTSAGAGATPTWSSVALLPTGTTTSSTLRWSGTAWVENTNVLESAAGLVTANAGANLNGTSSPLLLNNSAGTTGQVLTSAGAGATPTWSTVNLLPSGTTTSSTLRWSGTAWVENTNVLESAAGLVTANAGANLNGTSSPLLLNNAAGTTGQVLTSAGAGATPTWSTVNLLPSGTTTNSTLRWSGTAWVENANILGSSAGLLTVNAGANLNGTASPMLLNNSAGTTGQVLTSAGAGATPTWSTVNLLPSGTTTNSTLRWSGTAWVENTNILGSSAGLLTVNAGVNLSGTASPMLLNNSAGTTGQVLTSAGAGATPTWSTVNLLPNGTTTSSTLRWNGTAWVENTNVLESAAGLVTANAGANLNGTSSPLLLNNAAGTTGQVLTSAGAGATPTWSTVNLLPSGTTTNSTLRWSGTAWVENANILGSSAGLLTVNAGANLNGTASPLLLNNSAGTTGQVLTSAGAGATPTWSSVSLLPSGTTTNSTLRWTGTAWVENTNILGSSAGLLTVNAGVNLSGTASPLLLNNAAGTSGQVLVSAGAGATPTWTSVSILPSGTVTNSTLRWTGTAWSENTNVLATAGGLVTVNSGVNFNGSGSPVLLNNSAGTTGQVIVSAGAGATPAWTTLALLPNGTVTNSTLRFDGTSWVENGNVLESASGQVTVNAGVSLSGTGSPITLNGNAGNSGQFLVSNGAAQTPTWTTGSLLPNGTATDNTLRWNGTSWVESANVKSNSAGELTVNAGVNYNGTTSPVYLNGAAGTTGQVLTSAGATGTPTWTTISTLPTGSTTNSTLRWSGTAWVENTNVTATSGGLVTVAAGQNFTGTASPILLNNSAGTSGQFLMSGGAGTTPSWTSGTLLANGTATDNTLRWSGTNWVENANTKSSASGLVTVNAGVNLNGASSPLYVNSSAGTAGQVLTSGGAGTTPSWTTMALPSAGTVTNSTLRWSGTAWVENTNVLATSAGQVTVAAGQNFNGVSSPILLNNSAGTSGQFLMSNGSGSTPSWSTGSLLPNGTATDNTLRWSGTQWVESATIKSSAAGQLTVSNGVSYNGTASPVLLNGAAGTSGQVLISQGAGATPTWATGSLLPNATATDNTLRWNGTNWVESSGVKSSSGGQITTIGGVNFSGASSQLLLSGSAGTNGQVLTSAGGGATPTWTTISTVPAGTATDNTLRWNGTNWVETSNVKSSATGLVTVNAGLTLSGASSPLVLNASAGTAGQFLMSAGTGSTPTWATGSLVANGTATDNTLRWNGTSWVESSNVSSSAAGKLTAVAGVNLGGTVSPMYLNNAAGTSGQVLTSAGPGATPTWTTPSTIGAGTANDNTLRWNGTNWVESANVKSSAAGMLTANAGVTLSGTSSTLNVRGSDGTLNYVLAGMGTGNAPQWTDPNSIISAWKLAGNSGTTPGTGGGQNYMGTTDAKDLVFATNGMEHLRIASASATTVSSPMGIIHARGVLPGGTNGLITGMTVETVLPSTATVPSGFSAFGGFFSNSTLTNSATINLPYCALNSTVTLNGAGGSSSPIRANDGIAIVDNVTGGLTHTNVIGHYGSVRTGNSGGANTSTITTADAFRANFTLNSTNGVMTTANGLFVENPSLQGTATSSDIGTFNGIYVQSLTTGTTKRAFLYDGTGSNVPVAITSAGQVGIGRNNPTQALEIYNGNVLLSNNTNTGGMLSLAEPSGSGSNVSTFVAQAQSADIVYTLPAAAPSANQVLTASSVSGAGPYAVTLAWAAAGGAGSGWSLTGNSGTTAGTNFVGTTDNVAFDVKVNNARVMEYQPNATSPNIVGGYSGNSTAGALGATIAGGGASGSNNTIAGNYGSIGGGLANNVAIAYGTVGGGSGNSAGGSSGYTVVAGGHNNLSSSNTSSVGGGEIDTASGDWSHVGGGYHNFAGSAYSSIAGGTTNHITTLADYSVIAGGSNNSISGSASVGNSSYSSILGGYNNVIAINSPYSTIAGGENLKLGGSSFGVNMGTAADLSGSTGIAYFGNMNVLVNNTDGTQRRVGVNTNTPNTGVDVNGDFALRDSSRTGLVNGNNNNLTVGGRSFLALSGPNAAFTITGIAGGVNGKVLVLYNNSGQKMTISNNDAASNAANRIFTRTGANWTTATAGDQDVVTLIYSSVKGAWLVMSIN